MFGFLISFYGVLIGFVIDLLLGTQRSLLLGACLLICGRLLLAVAEDTSILRLALYLIVPLGEALAIPVLTVMLKRYSLPENRAAAFGLFYVTMNVGAMLSGWMVQVLSDLDPASGGCRALPWHWQNMERLSDGCALGVGGAAAGAASGVLHAPNPAGAATGGGRSLVRLGPRTEERHGHGSAGSGLLVDTPIGRRDL